jgi:hypothetical protein
MSAITPPPPNAHEALVQQKRVKERRGYASKVPGVSCGIM